MRTRIKSVVAQSAIALGSRRTICTPLFSSSSREISLKLLAFNLRRLSSRRKGVMETVLIVTALAWLVAGVDVLIAFNKEEAADLHTAHEAA